MLGRRHRQQATVDGRPHDTCGRQQGSYCRALRRRARAGVTFFQSLQAFHDRLLIATCEHQEDATPSARKTKFREYS